MRSRRHRYRLLRRIDAGGHAACMDSRKFFGEMRTESLARVEECATAGCDLRKYAACHDVARRKFGEWVARRHESFALVVDQHGAFTAQGFGRKRRRIAPDHDRG